MENKHTETHPLEPFLPKNSKILMLGSFPPPQNKWSMDFFYPNFINDMWRIFGIIFFGDRNHFVDLAGKRFRKDLITAFCNEKGIALYDSACRVRRLKDNASDKFLEIVEKSDLPSILQAIPHCRAIITTGQKSTDAILSIDPGARQPETGGYTDITISGRKLRLYRMPSSSRAYPMPLEKKAEIYRTAFVAENL